MMIAYDFNSNNILAEPLNAYQNIRNLLCSRGLEPHLHVLYN